MTQPHLPDGLYRHYKGRYYRVLGVARHSETEAWYVVYQPEYGDRGLWIRPLEMFQETVLLDGQPRPRFEFLGPAAVERWDGAPSSESAQQVRPAPDAEPDGSSDGSSDGR